MSAFALTVRACTRQAFLVSSKRTFSSTSLRTEFTRQSTTTSLSDTIRNVAERAHEGVTVHANVEGFKAGVLYTLLGGSALTAGYLMISPREKDVREKHLL